jgi:hypothetical protein
MANLPTRLSAQIVRTPITQTKNSARRVRANFNILTELVNSLMESGFFYQNSAGTWSIAGHSVTFADGAPAADLAMTGNYYVDLLTGNVYLGSI